MTERQSGPNKEAKSLLRRIPSVDTLLSRREIVDMEGEYGRRLLVEAVRRFIEEFREAVLAGRMTAADMEERTAAAGRLIIQQLEERLAFSLRRVINATGVVVHTNLGRSPLSPATAERVAELSARYNTLEYDLASGKRGSRNVHFEKTLAWLTGAESGTVVNNNAAAVLLALNTLSDGRETIVSRGELVEIGGSFRIPEVMSKSGALLREVGTTNRTRLSDFEGAIGDRTGLLLKVHSSNYRIVGFTEDVPLARLADLGKRHELPLMYDLGSGCFPDLSPHGIRNEPTVSGALEAGADLVTFSGDKLLGGPQAGIIVGRRDLIARMDANPLKRALRVDKMTIAALELTLREYLTEKAGQKIPAMRMITLPPEEIGRRARLMVRRIRRAAGGRAGSVQVIEGASRVGGGAAPEMDIPTWLVSIVPASGSAAALEKRLRSSDPPVIARVQEDRLLLDLRTVQPSEERELTAIITRCL